MSRDLRKDALQIIEKCIKEAQPGAAVRRAVGAQTFSGRLFLLAIGKAAWQMADAARGCPGGRPEKGIVITKYGHSKGPIDGIDIYEAGHPVSDENTYEATRAALEMTAELGENDTLLFLVSGGGSALFEKPLIAPGEIEDINAQLLACGADIVEMNTIRKRLSAVKGGRFAAGCRARIKQVILSDVIGDRLDMIASGPAAADSSTCEEALAIVKKYGLKLSEDAMNCLSRETPAGLDNVESQIVGSVSLLCGSAKRAAEELGYKAEILTDSMRCEAREAGAWLAGIAADHAAAETPAAAEDGTPLAFIAGGETVVHIKGKGRGGRNQELALAAAPGIAGLDNVLIFSLGSDGTDGPTDAAGGIVTGPTLADLREKGVSVLDALEDNDSYSALQKADGLIMTGPTGTNVNDVSVLLIDKGGTR